MKKRLLALLLTISAIAGCNSLRSPALPIQTLPLPRASHGSLAWTKTGVIVVNRDHDPAAPRPESELWRLNADGSGYRPLGIERDPTCVVWDQLAPAAVSDGRVVFWNTCGHAVSPPENDDFLAAVDIDTATVSRLAPLSFNPHQIAWLTAAEHGWISDSSSFCAGITAIESGGIKDYPMVVGEGAQRFRVDSYFQASALQDCSATGLADLLAATSDGSRVTFFAAPDSVGLSDSQRLSAPYSLYVADATAAAADAPILDAVVLPGSLGWSPDAAWLVFSGTYHGSTGVWIVAPDGSHATVIAGADAFSPAWSPDGGRIVVNRSVSNLKEAPNDELAIIDVSSIVGH